MSMVLLMILDSMAERVRRANLEQYMPPHMSDGICTRYQPHDERRIACRGRILACM